MEVGVHTDHGQPVQWVAEEEHKSGQEHALTHLHKMVEIIVLDLPEKVGLATPTVVQFMEAGVHSHPGQAVQLIAEEEHKSEQEPALTHLHKMVEIIVLDLPEIVGLATPTAVQFMEAGVHSHPGPVAQLIAEEEHKPEQEAAPIQLLNTEEMVVQDFLSKARVATPIIVQ